ncbi:GCN5 family acetyltransferase [Bacillus sp. LL01]|uniref:GNAT family N-acetyltransferase n=1 Tax=Bacillus sp. LL01 TaxID=1665556 RepID=UPI00064D27E5|nr:GNAT family protein [Bacillus sp. LL01]KMJ57259.1 GCN5 family acetyltransferase [Bacillus sp. LL01]
MPTIQNSSISATPTTIQGTKIQLKKLTIPDLPELYHLMYGDPNPEYKKWDAPYFPLEIIDEETYITKMTKQINGGMDSIYLIQTQTAEPETIGSVIYYWEHEPSNWLEMGIIIYLPKFWNGGYGTEAIKLWTDYLFHTKPQIPRVGYTTWSGNLRMVQVGKKLNFTQEACIRNVRNYQGKLYDSIRMGMLREEWENQQAKRRKVD